MEYVCLVFGIFGFIAFCQMSSLETKLKNLEEQFSKMEGTPAHAQRMELIEASKEYIGKNVQLHLKEDYQDIDITLYGNTKKGSNTIVDCDEDWMLVHVETPKGEKNKLIRMNAIMRVTVIGE